jgi:hypothetical protein
MYLIIVYIYKHTKLLLRQKNKEHNKQNTYLIHYFVCPNVYPVSSPFSKLIAWQAAELKRPEGRGSTGSTDGNSIALPRHVGTMVKTDGLVSDVDCIPHKAVKWW